MASAPLPQSSGKNDTRDFYVRNDSWRLAGQYLQGGKARGKCWARLGARARGEGKGITYANTLNTP